MKFPLVYHRTFHHTLPSTDDCNWEFAFYVTLTDNNTGEIIVQWVEPSLGEGKVKLVGSGVTWTILLKVYRLTERLAFEHAQTWNEDDSAA